MHLSAPNPVTSPQPPRGPVSNSNSAVRLERRISAANLPIIRQTTSSILLYYTFSSTTVTVRLVSAGPASLALKLSTRSNRFSHLSLSFRSNASEKRCNRFVIIVVRSALKPDPEKCTTINRHFYEK